MAAREPIDVKSVTPAAPGAGQRSPWHSPVPYLFGGLAAMLGLIAFALLILACSYWKLSGNLESGNDGGERDLEAGSEGGEKNGQNEKQSVSFEPKLLVIMAGEVKPTFLATPMSSSRSSSFGDTSSNKSCSCNEKSEKSENEGGYEMVKQGIPAAGDQVQSGSMETIHESSNQNH